MNESADYIFSKREISREDVPKLVSLLKNANEILKEELNYQILRSDKPIVFVGDTHGDIETTEKVMKKFLKTHLLVFLGDYVDRAPIPSGSIKNMYCVLENKIKYPGNVVMLRGNHEFEEIFQYYGFTYELEQIDTPDKILSYHFKEVFSNLPYVATTENGLIGLHGGIPNISSADEIISISKGIHDYKDNTIVLQTVWNDNVCNSREDLGVEGFNGGNRSGDERFLLYGEPYFSKKMNILEKKILVRGHHPDAKGYSLDDRILTVFTSQGYADDGNLKGVYVAVLDPQKNINTAKDLKIEEID